jgi:hypothetical protein
MTHPVGWWRRAVRDLPPAGPPRRLMVADLVSTVGTGLFVAGSTLFLIRAAGLPIRDVALGLTLAGTVGLAATLPVGRLADRYGPRQTAAAMFVLRAVAIAGFVLVDSLWSLVVIASLVLIGERGGQAAFGALVAHVGRQDRVRLQAWLRTITNIGVAIGAGAAGVLIARDSRAGYSALMLADAVALAIAAVVIATLPAIPRPPAPVGARRWPALRDRPYLAAAGLHGVLCLQYEMLTFALPVWVVTRSDAPPWIVSVLIVLNTVMVIGLQVPASRGVETPRRAAVVGRRAGWLLLGSCVLVALSAGRPSGATIVLLVAAVAVQTMGELWQAAASFALSFDLAQEHAHGEYQAVYAVGEGLERAVAPAVLGLLCIGLGPPGWLALGAIFAIAGALLPLVVRAAERRPHPTMEVIVP